MWLDGLAPFCLVFAWFCLSAAAGVAAHKLSTLYDHQPELTFRDLMICGTGLGWLLLVAAGLMCFACRSQGLYWHKPTIKGGDDKDGQG